MDKDTLEVIKGMFYMGIVGGTGVAIVYAFYGLL